jgi:hypothetical protein
MRFFSTVAGYRKIDDERNEGIRKELGITNINTIIKMMKINARTFGKNGRKQNLEVVL